MNRMLLKPAAVRLGQQGIALVLVLWVVTLLAVIAGSFVFSVRSTAQVTSNLASESRARAMADGGVYRAIYEMLRPETEADRWKLDGRTHSVAMEGGEVAVVVRPESAKIDLNTANEELLKGLFVSVGVPDDQANSLVAAIQDWRDADELERPSGAEAESYASAGLAYPPANADFETVDELSRVLGMTPDIFRQVKPYLTVYSKQPGLDTTTASRGALLAIPNVSPESVDDYLAERSDRLAQGLPVEPFAPGVAYNTGFSEQVYNVASSSKTADGATYTREVTVQIGQNDRQPFLFLDWH